MPTQDQILQAVKRSGPVIPPKLMRELGSDTFIIGAILSNLASQQLVKITHTKIGGTPAYYVSGQEPKLESLIQYLNGKDRVTAQLLKEKKVLQDSQQEALIRVSLRQIHDFAKKVEVNLPEGPVIFWRYYLVSEQDAAKIIREALGLEKKPEIQKVETPRIEAPSQPEKRPEPKHETPKTEVPKKVERKEEPKQQERKTEQRTLPREEKPAKEPKKEEQDSKLQSNIEEDDSAFFEDVKRYFRDGGIRMLSSKIITKKTSYEFILEIPSPVGYLNYFCVARNKKGINDGDLSRAYVDGQKKGMPILYLTTGKLTKKAQLLQKTDFKNMTVKHL
ncbi:MAG: hypothetical protein ABIA93_02135 [Candidatus Woesearchaeota archaeon]